MPTVPELNDLKDAFAEAYLYAVAAATGFPITNTARRADNQGIDYFISKKQTTASSSGVINIQLKGVSENSNTMFLDQSDLVKYNYAHPKPPIGAHYLVIVKLPSDDDIPSWLTLTEDELILKRCAYYTKILPGMRGGFIEIPKSQVFTHITLPTLFEDKAFFMTTY